MSDQQIVNLDYLAATYAQKILDGTTDQKPDNVDSAITKALGVLQEHGVYACFLYLLAKEEEIGAIAVKEMLNVLEKSLSLAMPESLKPEVVLKHITDHVTNDLERLLLAKEVLEQTLIYTRYGAKAREKGENS